MVAGAARRQGTSPDLRSWSPAAPESVSRSELREVDLNQLSSIQLMPICAMCPHSGLHHDWTSPPCSATECDCQCDHRRRLRGRCLVSGCGCPKYVPRTKLPAPVNPYIGKGRRWHG